MACKKASRPIRGNERRRDIEVVMISCENRIGNTAEHSRPCKDPSLIHTIEIMTDCEFLVICERFVMSSVFRLGGNAIEAISKLFFINVKISGCTRDIRLLETLKGIAGLANLSLLISVRFGQRVVE
jgi:hypothetical protein